MEEIKEKSHNLIRLQQYCCDLMQEVSGIPRHNLIVLLCVLYFII